MILFGWTDIAKLIARFATVPTLLNIACLCHGWLALHGIGIGYVFDVWFADTASK
jgi:hypothetical protein